MRNFITILILLVTCFSCKGEKKEDKIQNISLASEESQKSNFEKQLLDYRGINHKFNDEYVVVSFGVQRNKLENSYGFTLKLDETTNLSVIEDYSIGVKGYSSELEKPVVFASHPKPSTFENQNYIVLNKKIPQNIKYFDSMYFYIYKRKSWKESGNLGGFIIRDILFEGKN